MQANSTWFNHFIDTTPNGHRVNFDRHGMGLCTAHTHHRAREAPLSCECCELRKCNEKATGVTDFTEIGNMVRGFISVCVGAKDGGW